MPREKQPKEVMSLDEFMNFLRIGKKKALALLENGDVPGRKLGTRWRVYRDDAIDWLRSGKGIKHKEVCR
jgi:excisionase family DNA binding protein